MSSADQNRGFTMVVLAIPAILPALLLLNKKFLDDDYPALSILSHYLLWDLRLSPRCLRIWVQNLHVNIRGLHMTVFVQFTPRYRRSCWVMLCNGFLSILDCDTFAWERRLKARTFSKTDCSQGSLFVRTSFIDEARVNSPRCLPVRTVDIENSQVTVVWCSVRWVVRWWVLPFWLLRAPFRVEALKWDVFAGSARKHTWTSWFMGLSLDYPSARHSVATLKAGSLKHVVFREDNWRN